MKRRTFLQTIAAAPLAGAFGAEAGKIMTVNGMIPARKLGLTLIHEHILVDFIGADKISADRWDRAQVQQQVLPFLLEAKDRGVRSLLDCTPAFLGRDVRLLREVSDKTGLHILTNTGYYGAVNNKYLPPWAFTETAQQLADRWIREYEDGIEGTPVRPGFIKIGVDGPTLSPLHQKLIRAAGLTHLQTGLTICSHTGPAGPAFEQMTILEEMGVRADAFVWVHAQNEPDKNRYLDAARRGAWVSLDGMGWGNIENYADWLAQLKREQMLDKVLISHDAGWYRPGETQPMEKFVGYTALFDKVWPLLRVHGFETANKRQLLTANPARAFGIQVRKM